MVTRFCPLCIGVSQMNFPIAQTLSQNQILHECDAYNWSCGHFCDISAYFGQQLVAVATSLRPLQSQMSSLDWPTTKTPMDMSLTTEVTAFFVIFLPILAKIWLPRQRPLYPRSQKYLIWIGRPLKPYHIRTKNFVSSCYTSEVVSIWRFATSLALRNREFSVFLQ